VAFYSNQVLSTELTNIPQKFVDEKNELNKLELEYLLELLKNADLKGYQIEMFYNLAFKLQNQYLNKNK
jgi:hypothetical protein